MAFSTEQRTTGPPDGRVPPPEGPLGPMVPGIDLLHRDSRDDTSPGRPCNAHRSMTPQLPTRMLYLGQGRLWDVQHPCGPRGVIPNLFPRRLLPTVWAPQSIREGGGDAKQAKSGMAQCGTTKVCQIVPRYLKVRGHFSGCHCERSGPERFQCVQQPNSLREIRRTIQATVQKPTRNDSNQPKAHRQ